MINVEFFLHELRNTGPFARRDGDDQADVSVDASREELLRAADALCPGGQFADESARRKFDQLMARIEALDV